MIHVNSSNNGSPVSIARQVITATILNTSAGLIMSCINDCVDNLTA